VLYFLGLVTDGFSIAPLFLSITISIVTAFLFINSIDKVGTKILRIATTSILRAFLANWMEDLKTPVENIFERLGSKKTIDFSVLAFSTNNSLKSLVVVPSFHPGPFKNVGSSSLPFTIQKELEKKMGCFTAVPHGLFGHEFDLSSQHQNRKVLKGVLDSTDFPSFVKEATGMVRVSKDNASASCQIFGKCALISLTMAPETTEDFPKEIGDSIISEALELGLSHVVIVNAHNSINGDFDVSRVVETLKDVSSEALRKASHMKPTLFNVGVAKSVPTEFSLEDGMGPGGIHVLLIRTQEDTCAYITIDGNNMVSGLREEILQALKDFNIDDGEIFTTDTHAVNAIVMTARGYHPIGEVMDNDILIRHIRENVKNALSNMEPASFGYRVGAVADVGVIGEDQIRKITLIADKALKRAKLISFPLFGVVGLVLVLFNLLV
jgi:putative membrane protein